MELQQIMLELFQNSISKCSLEEKETVIAIMLDAEQRSITVKDSCGGFEDDALEFATAPYFTTEFASRGKGLGLFRARMLHEEGFRGRFLLYNDEGRAVVALEYPAA